jgi:HTH-type transcriptional regulator, sugar sensing transcriptional regulator
MTHSVLIRRLQAIGLSARESQIYLAVLESGTAPASQIAEKGRINRVSAYNTLEKLIQKGLVEESERVGVKFFSALSPEIFVEETKKKARDIEESLPDLLSLVGAPTLRPSVRFFEGIEGVKRAYRFSLEAKTQILNYANSKNLREHWAMYDQEYVQKRTEKNIFLRGLAPDDAFGKRVQRDDSKYHRETRLLNEKHFAVENEIKIFDNKLMIASFEPHIFSILIESSAVADTQRQIFEIAWESAKGE